MRVDTVHAHVTVAEGVGFEPTEACTSHAFEACPFGRSGTLPGRQVSASSLARHSDVTPPHPASGQESSRIAFWTAIFSDSGKIPAQLAARTDT